ncbi:hypothetical protein [Leifsonia virtsii]|uniref:Minor tail protein n=1 Tax=Leifsonia virtsii TaxID=3035915 RepID=A0ABT8J1A7_9MICO|nr:hypothetical protein [Leifsonia virtsii]MDN4598840.1 hypothetical protein [Leifsonia virtsii]
MASGHLDENGIWQYGEDDPRSPFSDTLNMGQEATSVAIGALLAEVGTLSDHVAANIDLRPFASKTDRDAFWGVPGTEAQRIALQNRGALAYRTDLGMLEHYLATYNAGTNPQGAKTPDWYPAGGVRPSMDLRASGTVGQNVTNGATSPVALIGGAAGRAFGAPTGSSPFSLVSQTYTSTDFSWKQDTGDLKVLREGLYRIRAGLNVSGASAGLFELALVKNYSSGAIPTDDKTLVRSGAGFDPGGEYVTLVADHVPILTSDTLRLIAAQNSGATVLAGNLGPASCFLQLEYEGPIRA